MIIRRSMREINKMRVAGQCVARAHQAITAAVAPGVTTRQLDALAEQIFAEANAVSAFKGYPGPVPFPAVTCMSVNAAVVHGIPDDRPLQVGDILSVDTGCRIDGWCGDAAVTHAIGEISPRAQQLLQTTRGVLDLAIELLPKKAVWSEVAEEMQQFVEAAGFNVVKQFVGHGIGREMHEKPDVPNYVSDEFRRKGDFRLKTGLVLAIEPMVCAGTDQVHCLSDGWTQVTRDGQYAAHFEHTVALTTDGPDVLTRLSE